MNCPKCNKKLKVKTRKTTISLKGVKVICECGYKAKCIDWNLYISTWREFN